MDLKTKQYENTILNGERTPDINALARLAKYFNVSADYLLETRPYAEHSSAEVYKSAIDTYGMDAQKKMAIEEMSELTKELCKNFRGRDNGDCIAEEIADVKIMLEQLIIMFDRRAQVERFIELKTARLKERLGEIE